jgi:hypothetical protein
MVFILVDRQLQEQTINAFAEELGTRIGQLELLVGKLTFTSTEKVKKISAQTKIENESIINLEGNRFKTLPMNIILLTKIMERNAVGLYLGATYSTGVVVVIMEDMATTLVEGIYNEKLWLKIENDDDITKYLSDSETIDSIVFTGKWATQLTKINPHGVTIDDYATQPESEVIIKKKLFHHAEKIVEPPPPKIPMPWFVETDSSVPVKCVAVNLNWVKYLNQTILEVKETDPYIYLAKHKFCYVLNNKIKWKSYELDASVQPWTPVINEIIKTTTDIVTFFK